MTTLPPQSSSPGPLHLLLLLSRRLEREAFTALVDSDPAVCPLAAPSVTTAERMLAEQGNANYVVLIDEEGLDQNARSLFRRVPPRLIVVLRGKTAGVVRDREGRLPVEIVCRDTPWRVVANRLAEFAGPAVLTKPAGETDLDSGEQSEPGPNESSEDDRRLKELTRRERQILELVSGGASVRECAESLHIAESTVDNHKSRLMKKVGVRKSSELVRFAFRVGIAP
ncbi:MAG: LuxR C-terminal-related transcriptional regulator [Planctomycetota bacterium]